MTEENVEKYANDISTRQVSWICQFNTIKQLALTIRNVCFLEGWLKVALLQFSLYLQLLITAMQRSKDVSSIFPNRKLWRIEH